MTSNGKGGRGGISRRNVLKTGISAAALTAAGAGFDVFAPSIARAALKPEKEELKFGFIKLTGNDPMGRRL